MSDYDYYDDDYENVVDRDYKGYEVNKEDQMYGEGDFADRWLAKYTHQSLDLYPGSDILRVLKKRYKLDNKTIVYRGKNFNTKEDYDNYLSKLKDDNYIVDLGEGAIQSWSPDLFQSYQFAITQPTYFQTAELMKKYDKFKKENEKVQGYRGIILETVALPESSIDVRKSDYGKVS